ncbi:VPLPA-CTERM sorting domain-containing protein [Roseovarius sp. D22-M7]|uniref:VPLPA-CTERM sorting domain-containing protein n=1 Tax=Roseovarius sp. D22-M7 TaxID=3127116 RepID=UPI00300FE78A
MKPFLIFGLASLCIVSQPVHAATLTSLLAGDILTEGDVQFSNFTFEDFDEFKSGPFPRDFIPDPDEITVTTSATSSTTTLKLEFDPDVLVSSDGAIFAFFIDFDVAISGGSSHTLTGLTLGAGDLSATGDAFAEVLFFDAETGGNLVAEIFEDTIFGSEIEGNASFDPSLSSLSLFGTIEGETNTSGSTAGLSTFALTFGLDGTPPVTPPVTPIPLPASLPLILAGLGSLVFLRRRHSV